MSDAALFTGQNARRYFEARLPRERWTKERQGQVHCPFHDDRNPSMSVNLDKGLWCCHGGCGGGGILDFEMKLSSCDRDTALARIAEVLGQKQIRRIDVRKPDAIYQYPDSQGKAIVEKLRFRRDDGSKYFEWRRPDGKGGYESGLGEGFRKRLYRLPNDSLFEQTGGLAVPFT